MEKKEIQLYTRTQKKQNYVNGVDFPRYYKNN